MGDDDKSCPDCLECCGECWVRCVSIVSIVVGSLVLVAGIFVILGLTVLGPTLDAFLSSAFSAAMAEYSSAAITASSLFAGLLIVGIAFIIIGVGMIAFGAVGCTGACKKKTCFTAVYAGLWGLLVIGELVIVIWYAAKQNDWITIMNSTVTSNLQNYYADIWQSSMNTYSLTWNYMMYSEKCCGYSNYTDFLSATLWYTSSRLNVSCSNVYGLQAVPIACCPATGAYPQLTVNDECCLTSPTYSNSYIGTPCYTAMANSFYAVYGYVVGIGTAVIGIEILLFLMLVFLTVRYQKVDVKAD